MTPPANNLGRAAPDKKDIIGASKCSVEKPAHGGFQIRLASQNIAENQLETVWRHLTPNESLDR